MKKRFVFGMHSVVLVSSLFVRHHLMNPGKMIATQPYSSAGQYFNILEISRYFI